MRDTTQNLKMIVLLEIGISKQRKHGQMSHSRLVHSLSCREFKNDIYVLGWVHLGFSHLYIFIRPKCKYKLKHRHFA